MRTEPPAPVAAGRRVRLGPIGVDPLTEAEVLDRVGAGWDAGRGGLITTPNVDIWRMARRDPGAAELLGRAAIVVADGTPLLWAARLAGTPLPERVTGSGLVEALAGLIGRRDRSLYVIGGGADETAADRAAAALQQRHKGLKVVGRVVPPYGFDTDAAALAALVDDVVARRPDLILVGLGFPRQEQVGERLLDRLPAAWVLGCGAGVTFAAGDKRRASTFVQRIGAEWLFRLIQEPRRLFRRYVVQDAPAALVLLSGALASRLRRR